MVLRSAVSAICKCRFMLTSRISLMLATTSIDAENQTMRPTTKAKACALIVTSQPKLTYCKCEFSAINQAD